MNGAELLPTHDETPLAVRLAHAVPTRVFGALLAVALAAGALTLIWSECPIVGAVSACAGALSAAGFVLHDRPRVLSKRWSDLYWDPDMEQLAREGLVSYESTASGVWVIRQSDHRKGRFPLVRLIDRRSPTSPWTELKVDLVVSPRGDVTVRMDVARTNVDDGREVAVIVS